MIQPLAWTHSFLRFPDGDTPNLLLNTWTILAVAVDEKDMGEGLVFRLAYHGGVATELIETNPRFRLAGLQVGMPNTA